MNLGLLPRDHPTLSQQPHTLHSRMMSTINYVGHASKWDDLQVEGDIKSRDCLVRYRRNGKVMAIASIFRDIESLKEELSMERAV